MTTRFSLGATSRAHLSGVHPDLVACVERAIQLSAVDFAVHEGLRSIADQLKAFNEGKSRLKFGKHQPQADGFGHAVDLVPWIDGGPVWDWPGCYAIAAAMRLAAAEQGVAVRWGGVWDRSLSDLIGTAAGMAAAHEAYHKRVPHGLADGPHFEIKA